MKAVVARRRQTLDTAVLEAMRRVPRHAFVPAARRNLAYANRPSAKTTPSVSTCRKAARPHPVLDAFYGCASSLNLNGYCSPEVDKLIERQSAEANQQRREQQV